MKLVIMTGLSGAGKSHAVKYLEDIGYFCVDNLPSSLIPKFAELCLKAKGKMQKIALVIDSRGGEFLNDFFPALELIKEVGLEYEILFLEASDEVLIKRFKESRRTHPLSPQGRIIAGINEERTILQNIKDVATNVIDTSNLTPRQLKEEISNIYVQGKKFEGLIISVNSFGFKYGIPTDCDLVFDVRFIPNPYYIESMKRLTGQDQKVREFVLMKNETIEFMKKLDDILEFLIPYYVKEGKHQLVVGIGCTGGRHRSVAIAEEMYKTILSKQHRVIVDHRDIDKDSRSRQK